MKQKLNAPHTLENPSLRNKDNQNSFAYRLHYACKLRQVLAIDIAKQTGISKSTISLYANGKSEPGKERLLKLAAALRVDPAWLYGLSPIEAYRPYDETTPDLNSDLARIQHIYNSLHKDARKYLLNTANILFENSTIVSNGHDN